MADFVATELDAARNRKARTPLEIESLLTRLHGGTLSQVWFVMDYLQLIFQDDQNDWSWQCFAWPHVEQEGRAFTITEPGYRDALCSLIGSTVEKTEESTTSGLTVSFQSGAIALNPTLNEVTAPEIAMLHVLHGPGLEFNVWFPGEDAFIHLQPE